MKQTEGRRGSQVEVELLDSEPGLRLVGRGTVPSAPYLDLTRPVVLELLDPSGAVTEVRCGYDRVEQHHDGVDCSSTTRIGPEVTVRLTDRWRRSASDSWALRREVRVDEETRGRGLRVRLQADIVSADSVRFDDFSLFAASANYNGNDLDEDGLDDYLESRTRVYRDDRLNSLSVMAYEPRSRLAFSMARASVPGYDERPHRSRMQQRFLQCTDIGSLGFVSDSAGSRLSLQAAYPFWEGDRSFALDLEGRQEWGAFWDLGERAFFEVEYLLRIEQAPTFLDAIWLNYSRRIADLAPVPVALNATFSELHGLRAQSLDQSFLSVDATSDPNAPAGYVLNCHPQSGEQLADVIQYGFTGQNTLNAWAMIRSGDERQQDHARRVIDFFVDVCHIPDPGLFYDLYNTSKQRPDSWWTGLLLPLAYAETEADLAQLMGPVATRLADVITELEKISGSYLRTMSESAQGVLRAYEAERAKGIEHPTWLAALLRYADFLVRSQQPDGSWYRAYDHSGQPVTAPARWFGTTDYERKSSTACPIPFLVGLAALAARDEYLQAARRAGEYVLHQQVLNVRFNGGVQDSLYRKAQLVDNESILFPMLGLWSLYRATGESEILDGATAAARLFATWTWLWDVPLPTDSTLYRYGFRSTGLGACDTCAAGYVHPFELLGVPELVQIGVASADPGLIDVAELILHGCNQTVAVPGADWGYKVLGLQEEGYVISWWLADDPIFDDTAFGGRGKGEGNKTCFPWLPAVAMTCYLGLTDAYGTARIASIRDEHALPTSLSGDGVAVARTLTDSVGR